jgi:hypothetical protein
MLPWNNSRIPYATLPSGEGRRFGPFPLCSVPPQRHGKELVTFCSLSVAVGFSLGPSKEGPNRVVSSKIGKSQEQALSYARSKTRRRERTTEMGILLRQDPHQEARVLNLIGGAEGYLCSQSIKPALTPARLPFPSFFLLGRPLSPMRSKTGLARPSHPSGGERSTKRGT